MTPTPLNKFLPGRFKGLHATVGTFTELRGFRNEVNWSQVAVVTGVCIEFGARNCADWGKKLVCCGIKTTGDEAIYPTWGLADTYALLGTDSSCGFW